MTLYEWVNKYMEKSKSDFAPPPGSMIEFDEEKGFVCYYVAEHPKSKDLALYADATCGDGKHWEKFLTNYAKENGIKSIITYVYRDSEAYKRLFQCKCIGSIMEKEVV